MKNQSRFVRARGGLALAGVGGLLASIGLVGLGPIAAEASSHREAPLIAGQPQYDTTDVYAFRSPERAATVTLIANWIPFEEPGGGPNFYSFATDARYNIKVDNNGDANPDITFRWTFTDHYRSKKTFLYANGPVTSLTDPNLNYYQTYKLEKIAKGKTTVLTDSSVVVPSNVGKASMPDYQALRKQGTTSIGSNKYYKSFAGQAEDPFFLDLRVFDLLYGGDFSEVGTDTLAGFNVNSVALQVPQNTLALDGNSSSNPIIGLWSTTERRGVDGAYRQVSRLGAPLVNEVVIPIQDKDKFNAASTADHAQFLPYVQKPELPQLIKAVYGLEPPAEPRNDLVSVFLTGVAGLNKPTNVKPSEQLRLNMSTPVTGDPNRLGVIGGDNQGYPNGRRLTDDVVDISLQVVEGELTGSPNDLGDGVNANDNEFGATFPYLGLPESGSNSKPHAAADLGPAAKSSSSAGPLGSIGNLVPSSASMWAAMGLGAGGMVAGAVVLLRPRRRLARAGV